MRHAPILPVLLALAAFGAPASAASEPPPQRAVQSAEDRGFAIVLTSPTEPWLNGRQAIRIEAIIPRDDTVEQVDFFIDRKLAFVDTDEPYQHTFDFGAEIRRHTIEVKALTKGGRRARVSFVSRSIDLAENAQGRIVTLTAMVRDTAGHPVDRLNVSDFSVTEEGVRQPIVHFLAGPSPASMAVVVEPEAWIECRAGLERFLSTLPGHQAVALLGAPENTPLPAPAPEEPGEPAATPAVGKALPAAPVARAGSPFTYDLAALVASMPRGEAAPPEPAAESPAVAKRPPSASLAATLTDRLVHAATALASRRGPRRLLLVAAVAPFGDEPIGPLLPAVLPEAPKPGPAAVAGGQAEARPADPLAAALEEARKSGAAVHVIALPAPDRILWHEANAAALTLKAAVEASGGSWDEAADAAGLERAFASVTERLRNQYLVSYVSGAAAHPGWRPLEVRTGGREWLVEA
ncbi:MAG TPA: hypothetical protein VFD06_05440, partial [Candidatus Polarisedimenticolia bacterium]|nr:hypothetical protein [Candidatus Polarisedimenticolia bacterium]